MKSELPFNITLPPAMDTVSDKFTLQAHLGWPAQLSRYDHMNAGNEGRRG